MMLLLKNASAELLAASVHREYSGVLHLSLRIHPVLQRKPDCGLAAEIPASL